MPSDRLSDMQPSGEPLWIPDSERVAAANMTRFASLAKSNFGFESDDYESLWRWSVERPTEFWTAIWDFCEVIARERGERVLVAGDRMPGARWFPDAKLNYAQNLLRRRDDIPAMISWNEQGRQSEISFRELYQQTAQLAAMLRSWGIQPGDRIAALLPNIPEAVVVLLAAASIGATFSSCSPDFGIPGIVDRFGQIAPRVLFLADGYLYGGKRFATQEKGSTLLERIPSIERVVLIPYLDFRIKPPGNSRWSRWADALDSAIERFEFAQLPFDHPLAILYSSGTTGVPKCIIHGAGGTLLQHLKEHRLHTDLKPGDRLFYFTTIGWMMWNWLASALASECTLILFDGSPVHPQLNILWDMADAEKVTAFGTSAKYLSALEKSGSRPRQTHRLDFMRTILSTGSPLLPESFDYVYRNIKADVCLSSISGGTDIVSCFVLGNSTLPVHRGEIQCRGLGMKVNVFDEQGRSITDQMGELVCTAPFPSMPVGFWNDAEGRRYRAAYFERFPGVWCHGDFTQITPRGTVVISGRSDAVLNPGGVRIGTAEIYRQVEQVPEVLESLAVGQQWQGDVRIVLFVRLRDGIELSDELRQKIVAQIRSGASPRHVPAVTLAVTEIPRTRSGKIVELAVTDVIHGRPVHNLTALANPEVLDQYRDRPELN